jgi:hypothetical protein
LADRAVWATASDRGVASATAEAVQASPTVAGEPARAIAPAGPVLAEVQE